MKRIILILFAVTFLLPACSKEKKLNKKLDGEWEIVSANGINVSTFDRSYVFIFNKNKKEGTYSLTITVTAGLPSGVTASETETGTYTLSGAEKINLTPNDGNPAILDGFDILIVNSYSKTDMTLTNTDGNIYILKKK